MEEFHAKNQNLFKDELVELTGATGISPGATRPPNRQYFIYKNIILRNLYGVDIMHEATEIARLRLFLKMVAVVDVDETDPNLGLDPLPDIDFNIRCGNTLVGYASEKEIEAGLINGDMFAYAELKAKIDTEMEKTSMAFDFFRREQLNLMGDRQQLVAAKEEIHKRLASIRKLLDNHLYTSAGTLKNKDKWLADTQPFHWYTEFYPIIQGRGGFDVIIGNPPYVEYSKVKDYKVKGFKTESCGNLYAFVIERCFAISNTNLVGMIVPTSSISTSRMKPLQEILIANGLYHSTYGFRPSKLFDGGTSANLHLSILISCAVTRKMLALHHIKWNAEFREFLFSTLPFYTPDMCSIDQQYGRIVRCSCVMQKHILQEVFSRVAIQNQLSNSKHKVFFRNTGGLHYRVFTRFTTGSSTEESVSFPTKENADVAMAYFASNLWNMLYYSFSCCLHITMADLVSYPLNISEMQGRLKCLLSEASDRLNLDIKKNADVVIRHYATVGDVECYQVKMKCSKPIIDEIDELLAKHYGFTEEELDFIINYDIKYRMGDELNAGE